MGIYRFAQMVIKTDPCAFSEMKIYPGKGIKFAAKDGKTHMFISSKTRSLFHQKIKPVKLTWTQAWRRFNKNVKVDDVQRKKTRKTFRVQKAIVGLSIEEIKRKRAEKPADRDAILAKQAAELKDRALKKKKEKAAEKAKSAKAAPKKEAAVKNVAKAKVQKGGKR